MLTKLKLIGTSRLVLRDFREEDKPAMISIFSDGSVRKTYIIPDLEDIKAAEKLFYRYMECSVSDNRFAYGVYLDDTLIGFVNDCGIEGDKIEIGYVIAPAYQNNGYATEAVSACIDELFRIGYNYIAAAYFEENTPSKRVMEKCGMVPLGITAPIEYLGETKKCVYMGIARI